MYLGEITFKEMTDYVVLKKQKEVSEIGVER